MKHTQMQLCGAHWTSNRTSSKHRCLWASNNACMCNAIFCFCPFITRERAFAATVSPVSIWLICAYEIESAKHLQFVPGTKPEQDESVVYWSLAWSDRTKGTLQTWKQFQNVKNTWIKAKAKRGRFEVRKRKWCSLHVSLLYAQKKTRWLKSDPVMQTGSEDAPKEDEEMTKVGKKNTKLSSLKFHPVAEGSKHWIQSRSIMLL